MVYIMQLNTTDILRKKGLYTDVISVIQSFLMPTKEDIEEKRDALRKQLFTILVNNNYNPYNRCKYPTRYKNSNLIISSINEFENIYWNISDNGIMPSAKDMIKKLSSIDGFRIKYWKNKVYKSIKYHLNDKDFGRQHYMFKRVCVNKYNIHNLDMILHILNWDKPKYMYYYDYDNDDDKSYKIFRRFIGNEKIQECHFNVLEDLKKSFEYNPSSYIKKRQNEAEDGGWDLRKLLSYELGEGHATYAYKCYNKASMHIYYREVGDNSTGLKYLTFRNSYVKIELYDKEYKILFYRSKTHHNYIYIPFIEKPIYACSKISKKSKNKIKNELIEFIEKNK